MKHLPLTFLASAALAVAAIAPAAASADTLVTPAPGAKQLAAGGGYHAWFAPESGAWRLTLRAPDGTVTTPAVPTFRAPVQATIGSQVDAAFNRKLVVVYPRPDGDLHALDVAAGTESRVARLSSTAYREDTPQLVTGSYAFVRRGGKRPGIYFSSRGASIRRISTETPAELAFNGSRVAYRRGDAIVVRSVSGRGKTLVFRAGARPLSPVLTRYRVAWLEPSGTVRQTPRFAGSGGPYDVRTSAAGAHTIPGAVSIAMERGSANVFLDAEGLKRAVPPLF